MKSLAFIFVLLIAAVSSQDVSIPGDLLDVTTVNTTSTLDVNTRRPFINRTRSTRRVKTVPPTRPCDVVEPTIVEVEHTGNELVDDDEAPIPIPPIRDSRSDPAEREVIRLCPIGSAQNGSVCTDIYVHDCPEGYSWENDRCVLSHTSCPLNFEWNGSSCSQRRICPHNHIWKDGKCEVPTPDCPQGLTWNGEICEVDNIQCQHGSVLRGHECVIERFTCPPGFDEVNNECIKRAPICPSGYELNANSSFCTQENLRCPRNSTLINGECQSTVESCPPGSFRQGNSCYKSPQPTKRWTEPDRNSSSQVTHRPPIRNPTERTPHGSLSCPPGYTLNNNKKCYRCSSNNNVCNKTCDGGNNCDKLCHRGNNCDRPHRPTANIPDMNINIYQNTGSKASSGSGARGSYNILNNIEPINNTIHNINNITHPVTLNNFNENNIYIFTDTQCADGTIRTVVVKNNETINGCVDVEGNGKKTEADESGEEADTEPEKCCEIVTPRQCKKREENSWACTHRRYKYCGKFCIADRLYLKPPSTSYHNQILTLAPPHNGISMTPCFGRQCPPIGMFDFDLASVRGAFIYCVESRT